MAAQPQWPRVEDLVAPTIAKLLPELIDAALSDQKDPIDLLLRRHPAPNDQDPSDHVEQLETRLTEALAPHGIHPCRRRRKLIAGWPEPVWTTVYYRPAEEILFQALRDPHPVVLATTLEPQRYIDALVRQAREVEETRQIWLWRGASGRGALEQVTGWPDPDTATPKIKEPDQSVLQLSAWGAAHPETDLDVVLFQALRQLVGPHRVEEDVRYDGRTVRFWYSIQGNKLRAVVDDRELYDADEEASEQAHDLVKSRMAEVYMESQVKMSSEAALAILPCGGFVEVLAIVETMPAGSICIVPDAHHFLEPKELRSDHLQNIGALKDAYHRLLRIGEGHKVVLLMGEASLPKDLREEVLRIELHLPGRREMSVEIGRRFREWMQDDDEGENARFDGQMMRLSEEAAGMTLAEVRAIIDRVGEDETGDLCLLALRSAKVRHISRMGALELVDTSAAVDLGGMDHFLEWLDVRRKVFKDPIGAREIGIHRTPRGILLLGLPGSGKSLAAKVIARRWKLSLVRLDVGALRDKWVGSSEARIREALRVVEAMAPCILWIDEIDKGVGQADNVSSSTADLNIRATLLTWMQEHRYPVFTVATANRFAHLPPELTRAGRFDARFFFGCPGDHGREQIFTVHLQARGYTATDFGLKRLVDATLGFTGAEIEQAITDALYSSFARDLQLSTDTLLEHVAATKPLIRTAGKGLDEVWELVDLGRVEPASKDMLTRAQVAKLIDPYLYRPCYCRLEAIQGFDKQHADAARILMSSPLGGPAAVVMKTGEPDWLYVETNFCIDPADKGVFKFVDRLRTIELNFIFETLVSDYAIETIYFEDPAMLKRFQESDALQPNADIFRLVDEKESPTP